MSAPARPGPAVTATASMSSGRTPALANAPSMTGTIASRCARLATSGTTPPNRACWSIDDATSSARSSRPRTIPDAGLVAGRLDAEHQRAVGQIGHRSRSFRITIASTPDGW